MSGKFLEDFQQSIGKLSKFQTRLEQKSADKNRFNSKLVGSLKSIKDNIGALANKISEFKSAMDGLHVQVNTNEIHVRGKEEEIAQIKQHAATLEEHKNKLVEQHEQAQQQFTQQGQATQQNINECETRVRELSLKNEEIQNHLDAVNAELSGKGDIQAQHVEELQKQSEEFKQQLEGQSNANQEQQLTLTTKINDLEKQLQTQQQELQRKTGEVDTHLNSINKQGQEGQAQIAQLTKQLNDLEATNKDLVQRIVDASQVINVTVDKLQNLIMNDSNPDQIESDISEIELSIENIANVIQGRSPAQLGLGEQSQLSWPTAPTNIVLPGTTKITIQGMVFTLDDIKRYLATKSNQIKQGNSKINNKYQSAIVQLRSVQTHEQVVRIVEQFFNKGKFVGGKTKKRRRKQKGGFVYKQQSKRRQIFSSPHGKRHSKSHKSYKSSNF